MKIKLSDRFTCKKLLAFTAPSIAMMVFTSVYGIVDGFFVSNFVGKTSFAAASFIWPFIMVMGAVGFMFGAGGSALVSKTLGEGEADRAQKYFSMLVYASITVGAVFAVIGFFSIRKIAVFLRAEGELLENAVAYGRIIISFLPAYVLQSEFQSFFVTAEKPTLGLAVTALSGITNVVLDALFVAVFDFGIIGAAWATAISQLVGGIIPLLWFAGKKGRLLRLTKTKFYGGAFARACLNGSSELLTNVSLSIVSMLYNAQLLKYAGENGVAAYGVMMYVGFIFIAVFIGYTMGTAPVVGYNYGAGNKGELGGVFYRSLALIGCFEVLMVAASLALSTPFSRIYVGYDAELLAMTSHGFIIFSFSFLFAGYAIYSSGFFTALSDGLTSAIISFLRTFVFQVAAVLTLPIVFGIDGIWASLVVSEALAAAVGVAFLIAKRGKYAELKRR